ncbi:hypothetical protein BH23GEM6_BH23GEM6_18630 [soil metagenome]
MKRALIFTALALLALSSGCRDNPAGLLSDGAQLLEIQQTKKGSAWHGYGAPEVEYDAEVSPLELCARWSDNRLFTHQSARFASTDFFSFEFYQQDDDNEWARIGSSRNEDGTRRGCLIVGSLEEGSHSFRVVAMARHGTGRATTTHHTVEWTGAIQIGETEKPRYTVAISPAQATIEEGENQQFIAIVKDADDSVVLNPVLEWKTDDAAVATVNQSGFAIGVAQGVAKISVAFDGIGAEAELTVTAGAEIPPETFLVGTGGGSFSLFSGKVKLDIPSGAVSPGTQITVKQIDDGLTAKHGGVPGAAFQFGPSGLTFAKPVQLTMKFNPSLLPPGADLGSLYIYKLSGASLLQMTETQFLGADHLTTPLGGFSNLVIVLPPPRPIELTSIHFDPASREVPVGEFRSFRAVPLDQFGLTHHGFLVDWSIQNGSVASVTPTTYRRAIVTGITAGVTKLVVDVTFPMLGDQAISGDASVTVTGESTGLWVAGGFQTTRIATSPDGITWTARSSPFTWVVSEVAYNGSKWVAVGEGGASIATSPDGITWTAVANSPFTVANGVAWNGSLWVAVGQGSTQIATSTDGEIWTARATPFNSHGEKVAWGGGRWVATGGGLARYGPNIATSTDGINWTTRGRVFNFAGAGVAYNGSMWVATGTDGQFTNTGYTKIATSPDGIEWTDRASPFSQTASKVAWNGVMWVAVGRSNGAGMIATSPNGITWTARDTPFTLNATAIGWNGSLWVAGGSGGARLATSTDGINWTVRTSPITGVVVTAVWTRSLHIPY